MPIGHGAIVIPNAVAAEVLRLDFGERHDIEARNPARHGGLCAGHTFLVRVGRLALSRAPNDDDEHGAGDRWVACRVGGRGQCYSFTPTASDAQNNTLRFSISNKPVWATFNASTGRLSGSPTATQAGTYPNIGIRVSDGYLTSSLPAFGITVKAAPSATPANTAPAISGTPPTTVVAGSAYSFVPRASDAEGNALAFSIANKPAWAIFATATGALTGTPTALQAGSYANVVISASDGVASSSLPAFGITVSAPVAVVGSATLAWSAPTQNTDGTMLTDLSGYKVYHGTSAGALNDVVQVSGPGATSYTYTQLAAGTHYFAVSAFTSNGVESALSTVGSKTIQ